MGSADSKVKLSAQKKDGFKNILLFEFKNNNDLTSGVS